MYSGACSHPDRCGQQWRSSWGTTATDRHLSDLLNSTRTGAHRRGHVAKSFEGTATVLVQACTQHEA